MASYKCKVCAYIYNENEEKKAWKELSDSWNCPLCSSDKSYFTTSEVYECSVCAYVYDEAKEDISWAGLKDDWLCPICSSGKTYFSIKDKEEVLSEEISAEAKLPAEKDRYLGEWARGSDDTEGYFNDIHKIAESGKTVIEPMRSKKEYPSWDSLLFKGAQLSRLPLNEDEEVSTETVIGRNAVFPLILSAPLIVSHMSFGALSREAKISLAKGTAAVKTAMCSGEGGILEDSLESAYKYIFEYVPNKYSATDDFFKKVDAVEIKIGQSAKPGMGGHLPGDKVTEEIGKIRCKPLGVDIISPSRFSEITSREDLKKMVSMLKEKTGGKPIGVKIAAGHIEADLEFILYANPDFITIDGRPGATGAAPKFIKDSTSIPTLFALYRARKFLDSKKSHVSLIITGGLRISSDFAKAVAFGADAVAVSTAALIACGCQQYKICNTGRCPVGIATQDPELRKRLNIGKSSKRVENFLRCSIEEMKTFARITGNNKISKLSIKDICTTSMDIATFTEIEHV
jgi:methylamine---glutamate N-methyltransferase subunit C